MMSIFTPCAKKIIYKNDEVGSHMRKSSFQINEYKHFPFLQASWILHRKNFCLLFNFLINIKVSPKLCVAAVVSQHVKVCCSFFTLLCKCCTC